MIRFEEIINSSRKIFCECKCHNIFRLSEVEISVDEREDGDWLSQLDDRIASLESKIESAESRFDEKRQKIVDTERRRSERDTFKKIHRLVPSFSRLNFNARDLKTLGFPIKFISFDGKSAGWIKKIRLIDYHPTSKNQEQLVGSLISTIKNGNLEWKTLRVTEEGRVEEDSNTRILSPKKS